MTAVAIDPVALDYAVVDGVPARDVSGGLLNSVVILILTPLGSYWFDPTMGSKLHTLQRAKDVTGTALLVQQYAEQALQRLLDSKRAVAINVSTQQPGKGIIYLLVEVVAASGQRVTFQHPVSVRG
jgi:phage gp46-like protein